MRSGADGELEERFFEAVDDVAGREAPLATYLLTGIPGPLAHRRRLESAEALPAITARSLEGLTDSESYALREILAPPPKGKRRRGRGTLVLFEKPGVPALTAADYKARGGPKRMLYGK